MVWLYTHLSADEEIGLSSTTLKICLEGLKGLGREIEFKHVVKLSGLNRNFCSFFFILENVPLI